MQIKGPLVLSLLGARRMLYCQWQLGKSGFWPTRIDGTAVETTLGCRRLKALIHGSTSGLLERLHAVYLFFRGCRDEHNRPFFAHGARGRDEEVITVRRDRMAERWPGVSMYMKVGITKTGFEVHRCLRTVCTGGYHLHWRRRAIRVVAGESRPAAAEVLADSVNVRQAEKYGLMLRGHKLQLVDELHTLLKDVDALRPLWLGRWSQWYRRKPDYLVGRTG